MEIIAICAADRFWRAAQDWAARLTLDGNLVLHRAVFPVPITNTALLDRLHRVQLARIDRADRVLLLDLPIEGVHRLDPTTLAEIQHAKKQGKPIECLSARAPDWTEADCLFVPSPDEDFPVLPLPRDFPAEQIPMLPRFAAILAQPRRHKGGNLPSL